MAEQKRHTPPPADWFVEVVAEGIAKLYVLRLESAPAADTLDGVELVWVEALWYTPIAWDREQDAPRLRQAFRALTQRLSRWPAPRELMEHLPSRPKRQELPPPPPTPEQKARAEENLAKLKKMVKGLNLGGTRGD